MSFRSLRVIVVLVALMTSLLPWPAAAEPHTRVPRSNSVFELALGFVAQVWAKIGCTIDPSGYCIQHPTTQSTPQNQGEIGCTIDPDGHCIR